MKKLFLVFAKLLGLFQLYSALMGLTQILIMVPMLSRGQDSPLAGLVVGGAGLLGFLAASLGIAWVLLVRTEWLAGKVGLADDTPVEGLERIPALMVGVALIGVFVTVNSLPGLVRELLQFRLISDPMVRQIAWSRLISPALQLALGLFLALKPAVVVKGIARPTQA